MLRSVFIRTMALLPFMVHGQGRAAGGDTVQIMIEGGQLSKPIIITDSSVTSRFKVGSGPGAFELRPDSSRVVNMSPSFIIDWSRGNAVVPKGNTRYQLSFLVRRGTAAYVVFYAIDPSTQHGYVYIPGAQDAQYAGNTRVISRGVEGGWFYAWSVWEEVANKAISAALVAGK